MDGAELEQLRKDAKVSRDEVAARLGLTYAKIQRAEESRRGTTSEFDSQFGAAVLAIAREREQKVVHRLAQRGVALADLPGDEDQ